MTKKINSWTYKILRIKSIKISSIQLMINTKIIHRSFSRTIFILNNRLKMVQTLFKISFMTKLSTIKIINPIKVISKIMTNSTLTIIIIYNQIMLIKTTNCKIIFKLFRCKIFNQQVFQILKHQETISNNKISNIIKT